MMCVTQKCIKHAQIINIKVNNAGRKRRKTVPQRKTLHKHLYTIKKQNFSTYLGNFKSKAVSSDGNFVCVILSCVNHHAGRLIPRPFIVSDCGCCCSSSSNNEL